MVLQPRDPVCGSEDPLKGQPGPQVPTALQLPGPPSARALASRRAGTLSCVHQVSILPSLSPSYSGPGSCPGLLLNTTPILTLSAQDAASLCPRLEVISTLRPACAQAPLPHEGAHPGLQPEGPTGIKYTCFFSCIGKRVLYH